MSALAAAATHPGAASQWAAVGAVVVLVILPNIVLWRWAVKHPPTERSNG